MDIPITIKIEQSKEAELDRDLFGLGDKVTDPEIIKLVGEDTRYVNTSGNIIEGVSITHRQFPKEIRKAMESFAPNFIDVHFILSLVELTLGLGMNAQTIADWFLSRTKGQVCQIFIDGKEVKTTPEFEQKLIDFIKSNSDQ